MTGPQPEPLDVTDLAALAAQTDTRIQCLEFGGRKVWVKRAVKRLHPGHYLQMAMAIGLPGTIYRPSPPETGEAASRGEAERLRQFRAKGIDVPDLLYEGPGVLVLGDCGPTVEARLAGLRQNGDAAAHDALLLAMARGMAAVHAAGLVHGRPHPRDMFVRDDRVGFMDFEQNPLRAMSLDRAQARDALFLFGFVCDLAMRPETPMQAWKIWAAQAPDAASRQLAATLKRMKPLVAAGQLASRVKLGSDLRRFLAATGFLSTAPAMIDEERPGIPAHGLTQLASTTGKMNGNDDRTR